MRIGQLAERTGTSERLLRYYERVGLLSSARLPNGYRAYEPAAEQTVLRIRALLAAGLPTAVIREVLPCGRSDGSLRACPGVLERLRDRLADLDDRAAELDRARDTLRAAIAATENRPRTELPQPFAGEPVGEEPRAWAGVEGDAGGEEAEPVPGQVSVMVPLAATV
ncbi:MerR family transcriptional regulator [Streptacidiphilus pinicola]|uniref:MerR family transcriptional regulator n=1 Tax=Streptacidiphilus pinicola TaxID=2219663 RepID=A0A2X0IAP0_9ACTN|nr:MerR family transcriptional regulator [Streptacidiphilus pinicola]